LRIEECRETQVVVNEHAADNVCARISSAFDILERDRSGNLVIGLDGEWNVYNPQTEMAVLQIAVPDMVAQLLGGVGQYVFPIHSYSSVPGRLRTLLETASIIKAGRSISYVDAPRLRRQYSIEVNNMVELAQMASAKGAAHNATVGLASLCETVLLRLLPKPELVRCSDWEGNLLSAQQVKYAALDAYASLRVFEKLATIPDPARRLTADDVRVGLPVEFLANCANKVVATGRVVQFIEKKVGRLIV
jgi:hypothetical protein